MDAEPTPQVPASSHNNVDLEDINDRPAKRAKMEQPSENNGAQHGTPNEQGKKHVDGRDTKKGTAPIKAE